MYRFARLPRWVLSHAVVVVLVIALVNLGLWQLRRLDERRELNTLVAERGAAEVVAVTALLDPDMSGDDAAAAAHRVVSAVGVYSVDEEVLVRSRSLDGQPGAWVLTPLRLGGGVGVAVNRGWVPVPVGSDIPPEATPPSGRVEITGLVQATQTRGRFGSVDPATDELETLARADIARLDRQVGDDLVPAFIQLEDQAPAGGSLPIALERPGLDEGPHLSYAIQWFTFSAIAAGGYLLILRRIARTRAGLRPAESPVPDGRPEAPTPAAT